MPMRIYFRILGVHVHCRVFTTGSKCGDLVFTSKEWEYVRTHFNAASVAFIEESVGRSQEPVSPEEADEHLRNPL